MPSASRANGVAATPKKWQFVNVNEPKRYQDKDITSMVRAHAMRNVRRKQRLELTAQHQKRLQVAKAPESRYADSSVVSELSVHVNPNNSSIGHETDTDWSMALREMLSKLEFINLAHLASSNQVELEAERDEDAQQPDHLQSYGEDGTRAPKRFMLGTRRTGNPKSLLGDGVLDPFNALPIGGCANYNSHVLNHFASVMALNCLPVDQGKGQNSLTNRWLPYALQDSALFLATLTFAEVHLEILSGNYKSPRTLHRKGDSIKAVNAKLDDREHALSNEAIGAVAMLAAMESILGNYKELRIHMNGLQRMVYMRGGLQSLGWGGVLHMFISWQDLLSSAMMTSAPRCEEAPCCLLIRGSLPYANSMSPEPGLSTELFGEIATCFHHMRDLTQRVKSWHKTRTTLEIISFAKMRTDIVHRLLSIANRKPASEMTNLDYHFETCRLAALIFIKVTLHRYYPLCAVIRSLKGQLMDLINQGEANCSIGHGFRQQPHSIRWALFIGGILSLNNDEEEWFALRLARGIRVSGIKTWAEIEERLSQICWLDKLNTPACSSLWRRVESIHAEYWAGREREVASDLDREESFYWYPDSEEEAHAPPGS